LYADLAQKHGITHYYRARCFNGDPEFAGVLRSIFADAMTSQERPGAAVAPRLCA
jgi:protoheme ferro-lyase